MVESLGHELRLRKEFLKEPVETIYFGGGTPSILDPKSLEYLLSEIFKHYMVEMEPEITIEANPEDMSTEKLNQWNVAGINRLSVGIQSFDDNRLQFINRSHSGLQAKQALNKAKSVGFENLSCDLIYALPPNDLDIWKSDLSNALEFDPPHISLYSLTVESQTVFGSRFKKGELRKLTDEENAAQYNAAVNILSEAGYVHYEVSNFCKHGFRSQHNSNYWKGHTYLGIGPGAHSFDQHTRLWNVSNNQQYLKNIARGVLPQSSETLSSQEKANEYILTRLRTWMGIDLEYLLNQFKIDLVKTNESYISWLIDCNFAEKQSNILKLTDDGLARADEIILKFFQDKS